MIKSYRDLIVWQKSIDVVKEVYSFSFPKEEIYGLTSQIRRSAVSVPSNIAEGYGRKYTAEYIRFLNIARGSLFELETQIEIAYQIKYIGVDEYKAIFSKFNEIEKMLNVLIKRLGEKNNKQ